MHPVLAQETIHDLSTRHSQRVEAELRHIDAMTEGVGLPIPCPSGRPLSLVIRAVMAATAGLPKRLASSHA